MAPRQILGPARRVALGLPVGPFRLAEALRRAFGPDIAPTDEREDRQEGNQQADEPRHDAGRGWPPLGDEDHRDRLAGRADPRAARLSDRTPSATPPDLL